jgi:hypothetical protein
MPYVTYTDIDRSAPRVEWLGVEFIDGVRTEVPDDHPSLSGTNPFFTVAKRVGRPAKDDPPVESGVTLGPEPA